MSELPDMITVIDVMRAQGVEPTVRMNHHVGSDVGRLYRRRFGRAPFHACRDKTFGRGNHHMAVYPKSWFDEIAAIIRKYRSAARTNPS